MNPPEPPAQRVELSNGVYAPYEIESSGSSKTFTVTVEGSNNATYIDVYGLGIETLGNTEWPPASNITSMSLVDGVLHIVGSAAWEPTPFRVDISFYANGDEYFEGHITLN